MIWLALILICFFLLSAKLEEMQAGHALAMAELESRLRAAETEPRVIVLQVRPIPPVQAGGRPAARNADEGQDELRRYLNRIAKL